MVIEENGIKSKKYFLNGTGYLTARRPATKQLLIPQICSHKRGCSRMRRKPR
jgi:hypothetical protein